MTFPYSFILPSVISLRNWGMHLYRHIWHCCKGQKFLMHTYCFITHTNHIYVSFCYLPRYGKFIYLMQYVLRNFKLHPVIQFVNNIRNMLFNFVVKWTIAWCQKIEICYVAVSIKLRYSFAWQDCYCDSISEIFNEYLFAPQIPYISCITIAKKI